MNTDYSEVKENLKEFIIHIINYSKLEEKI
ncbi:MAG: hypothetical protein ACI8RD_012296 [Bacillariaceae sp.]|jgi:hypothetical protein